jgi:hypothetical protein
LVEPALPTRRKFLLDDFRELPEGDALGWIEHQLPFGRSAAAAALPKEATAFRQNA